MPIHLTDSLNHDIKLNKPAERIVSLVPSVTYTIDYFGASDSLVGLTRFCKLPEGLKRIKKVIGGTKDVNIERVKALNPDLIIANKEENTKETVEALQKIAPVYVSDVFDLESNTQFIQDLGKLIDKSDEADLLVEKIQHKIKLFKSDALSYKTAYMIWKDPWMTVGGDTFIHKIMSLTSFNNIFQHKKRYPTTSLDELLALKPKLVFLSSEPYPFKEKHREALQKQFPNSRVILVNGEAFTWFGAYPDIGLDYLLHLKKILTAKKKV